MHCVAVRRLVFLICALICLPSCSHAQTEKQSRSGSSNTVNRLTVLQLSGGSNVTNLGYGIMLNKGSSLQRQWYVVNDPSSAMQLTMAGINTTYHSSSIGGDYNYVPSGTGTFQEPVAAFEVRFLLFDVWGEHMKTLSDTEVADLKDQIELSKTGSWRAWSENEVSELLTVVSFVARVRKPDGTVWQYDTKALLEQVDKIKVRLTEKELTPEKEKPKS
jgi:hypothetical protein